MKAPNHVLKTIKKFLKKQDSGEMKLKGLAKKIAGKLDDDSISAKQVKQWIEESFLFTVEDKMVSLKRPRTESPANEPDEDVSKASKKPKLNENPVDSSSVSTWRKSNKIVIMHATDDAEGKDKSLELQGFKTYFPFTSFDSPAIKASICAPLLKQCTEGNEFSVPSPIQATTGMP